MTDADFLDAHNARHVWHPMAHPREMEQAPPRIIARAEGVHVVDHRGHRAIDAVGGLWNVNLGYSSEPVKRAIAAQLDVLPYASAFRGTSNAPLIERPAVPAPVAAPVAAAWASKVGGGAKSLPPRSAPSQSAPPAGGHAAGSSLSTNEILSMMSQAGSGCPLGPCKGCKHHDAATSTCKA